MKACVVVVLLALTTTRTYARMYEAVTPRSEREEVQASVAPTMRAETNSAGSFRPGAGTIIVAELSNSLDAKKAKVGDRVECEVVQDLVYKGRVIIPHGAKVFGHVSEATRSTKEQRQSRLGLVFERIILKDKRDLPFQYPAVITAVAAPIKRTTGPTTQMTDMPVQMEKGRTTGGAAIDAVGANANLAGANMRLPGTGAIGAANRGVIGIKGLALENTDSGTTVIVSAKGDVKLVFETQMVLRVTDASKK